MNELWLFFGFLGHNQYVQLIVHTIIAALLSVIVAKLATRKLQIVPSGCQNVMEATVSGILYIGKDVANEEIARKYLTLAGSLAIFIFMGNFIGIIPGFEAPTANVNLTLSLAILVFLYYHFEGIRAQGLGHYIAHFAGPVKWLAPLMFPVEILSHFSRIISLAFRLFGNIKGDDLFLAVLLMLAPWVFPLAGFALLTFSAFLQAFVFMVLTYVYIYGAVTGQEEAL
ncbi:F0F1 ATP synthase subunit A [Caminibacter pacificus]|jgi:F-type H+-transporting ATPase subunit a|uniref:ATP synthase subunit a n=1 Tax=Caminibacter pacificus TaxID=1424653 RepID=A0AAJ4RBY7_9BACT|nr:F0F1 ATP synthase subunit A [Caminibacter pacificus]NPA87714.1 F0F1 ATP synthase subunit A [Campylobacterota bacterium]QCI28919.1 F0F1 ATP synthase subunit A [Caminibacter pacificus]ROR39510.1 ATP synthase F0 subcomplex A subunit [Caminibacter pacificus]